ncbi:MAG TPA: outer membrane lipoprotein carrier protein LolA, partial [Flavobacterium sp.]
MNKTTNTMESKIQELKKNNTKRMSRFFQIAALLFLSFSIQAQDKKAKDLLDQVTAKVRSYNNIVIDFKYSLNNAKENINQDSKGNVTMKGNQFVLNFMGVTKIFDGKKSYTIVPEDEEITISKVSD